MSDMVMTSLPLLLEGLWITLLLSVAAIIGSTLLGLLAAVLRTSRVPVASHIAVLYTELFRGTPVLITLMFIYFGVAYFGYEINLFAAGILGLSIYQGAYIAEVCGKITLRKVWRFDNPRIHDTSHCPLDTASIPAERGED